jgi:hypothetical protein
MGLGVHTCVYSCAGSCPKLQAVQQIWEVLEVCLATSGYLASACAYRTAHVHMAPCWKWGLQCLNKELAQCRRK